MRSWRAQGGSAMMLVAAVGGGGGGEEDGALAAGGRDGGRQVRLPGDRGVDLLGLEHGGGGRCVLREDDVPLDSRAVLGREPRLGQEGEEQEAGGGGRR